MKIGFVSTWGEVGAAYVTRSYLELLKHNHTVFVYPRGLRKTFEKDSYWDQSFVEETPTLSTTNINWNHFKKWIIKNELDIIFFNEQVNIIPVLKIRITFPNIKIGTYVDYYTKDTINDFRWFDFIICNTQRHYQVFKVMHNQVYYIKWGVDVEMFSQSTIDRTDRCTFFHSSGWSTRKGTDLLLDVFIRRGICERANLIIHTQRRMDIPADLDIESLRIINKTVTHPGLYHLGDVYVYPTRLEGLGLTMYEALVSGLPLIVPDCAPMNEIASGLYGKTVDISQYYCREDAYYWPMNEINKDSLEAAMRYYIDLGDDLYYLRNEVRNLATKEFNWIDRLSVVEDIFINSKIIVNRHIDAKLELKKQRNRYIKKIGKNILELSTNPILHGYGRKQID